MSASAVSSPAMTRDDLLGFVDRYIDALVSHDRSRLPCAPDIRFTENNVPLRLGQGLWGTVTGAGAHDIVMADPVTGNAGFMGTMEESGRTVMVSARMKIAGDRVTELETVVLRKEAGYFMNPAGWNDAASLLITPLAAEERVSREEMIRVVDIYFDTLIEAAGNAPPFDPACNRLENGVTTTNNPTAFPQAKDGPLAAAITGLSAEAQFRLGMGKVITDIKDRRYTLIDAHTGLVFVQTFFHRDGTARVVPLTNGQSFTVESPKDTPNSSVIGEIFKIRNGKILQIQALIMPVPYRTQSVWVSDRIEWPTQG